MSIPTTLRNSVAVANHQVSLIINYDLPTNRENYVHRMGRSGRFGRIGFVINFAIAGELQFVKDIESFYSTQVRELPAEVAGLM